MEKLLIFVLCMILGSEPIFVSAQTNVIFSLRYRNFTNHEGALADGTCCDNPSLSMPGCPSNQCDTNFLPCATYIGEAQCQAHSNKPTGTMVDINSFLLQSYIGNVPGQPQSFNPLVSLRSYSPKAINFNIVAREITGSAQALMANFSFVIDWVDTFYDPNRHWRQMILTDGHCELGVDVAHQCAPLYYGPTCSAYCASSSQYTCLNDGSKNCTGIWHGPDCDKLLPNCTSDPCQNNGTCADTNPGYICSCLPQYSGKDCEQKLPSFIIISGKGNSLFNISGKTVSVSTSKRVCKSEGKNAAIIAASISAGLILLGVLTAALHVAHRMKKQKDRGKIQPKQIPPVSHMHT